MLQNKANSLAKDLFIWVWLKIKQEGLRRFWSMFPLARVDFGTGFLSHSHVSLGKCPKSTYLNEETGIHVRSLHHGLQVQAFFFCVVVCSCRVRFFFGTS